MIEQLIEQRLQAATSVKDIRAAVDLPRLRAEGIKVSPTVFVVELSESRQRNQRMTGPVLQKTDIRFALVYALSNVSDTQGAAAKQELASVRAECNALLHGWAPEGFEPIERGNSRLQALLEMTLWWSDEYLTSTLEVAPQ